MSAGCLTKQIKPPGDLESTSSLVDLNWGKQLKWFSALVGEKSNNNVYHAKLVDYTKIFLSA